MSKISYINKKDLAIYSDLVQVNKLSSVEDVSTVIETFKDVTKKIDYKKISHIVTCPDNFYYFVVGDSDGSFDLFDFINKAFVGDLRVSCLNAQSLFPLAVSRGIYDDKSDVASSGISVDDELPTSFLSDESVIEEEIKASEAVRLSLIYKKTGASLKIPKGGLIIGRSPKADFTITGNTNIGRLHCRIAYSTEGVLSVKDLESLNGTFVNFEKVLPTEDVNLFTGDTLSVADEEFLVQ